MLKQAIVPASTTAPVFLTVKNLESFYGPIMAIRGVSLEVREGQIVTVLGANGAGKTTLLKTISGVMNPEKGEIFYGGKNIAGGEPDAIVRGGIVHVPEGREVFPLLTVEDNLRMGSYTRRDASASIKADEDMVYGYFPILAERRKQAAGTLSGGQQQMLAIGRGLMARPKLMLLDEPSLGLSPLLVKEIFTIIRRLNREQGVTMMLVEQNAKVALDVADDGYVLELGRIAASGSSAELSAKDDIKDAYLGVGAHGQPERGQRRRRSVSWL